MDGSVATYGTAQMQLHTRARVVACPHAYANMCPITSHGTLVSLNLLHMRVTQRAVHTRMQIEWIHTFVRTHMILACHLCVVDRALKV